MNGVMGIPIPIMGHIAGCIAGGMCAGKPPYPGSGCWNALYPVAGAECGGKAGDRADCGGDAACTYGEDATDALVGKPVQSAEKPPLLTGA